MGGLRPLLGQSPALLLTLACAERVAPADAPLLVRGEVGAGHECFARYVHTLSRRAAEPFAFLECSEKSEDDFARAVVAAGKGTLYLHGIEALSRPGQEKLVHLISGATREANARFILGTFVDPHALHPALREELAAAIGGLVLELPPLRARAEDIPEIARNIGQLVSSEGGVVAELDARTLTALQLHRWPRNFPELEEMVTRLLALAGAEPPPSTEEYKMPVARVEAVLTFGDGRTAAAALFLSPGQQVEESFTRGDRFLPVVEAGVTRLYAMEAIASLAIPRSRSMPHMHELVRRVRVVLRSSVSLHGELRYAAERGRSRAIDFLNGASSSIELHDAAVLHIIAKAHIEHTEEL